MLAKDYFYVTALEDSVCVIVENNSMQFSFDGEEWNDFQCEEYDPSSRMWLYFYVDGIWKKMIRQGVTGNSTVICGEDEEFSNIRNEIVLDCLVEAGYNSYDNGEYVVPCCILLEKGQKLFLKGNGTYKWTRERNNIQSQMLMVRDVELYYVDVSPYTHIPIYFSRKNKFEVGGELMSLVDGEWSDSTKIEREAFEAMFAESAVADASNLKLPTDLSEDCFAYMFYKCESLQKAPELPATNLKDGCYAAMFSNCESLQKAPELPATNLKVACYAAMFSNCKSLEKAPNLPAEKLESLSYIKMFSNCSSLNYINVLSKEVISKEDISHWVDGVSTTGEFIAKNQYCEDLEPCLPVGDWTVVCSNDKPKEEPKEEPEQESENCNCDTAINGIYYKLDRVLKTAEVTCSEDSSRLRYSGVLEIPETIVVDDTTYTVTSISKYAFYVDPESGEDSLIIDEIRLPKTVLDIHTPFCCLPLPELPEYSSSMPNLVRQTDGNDGMIGSIPSKTDMRKIVISNKSSLKFICRDVGAAILNRLYLEDKKVDAKMVLEEMTGSSSFTNLKVSADSMWLVRETFEWIYDGNWWGEVESLIITNAEKLSSVQSLEYLFKYGCALENVYLPCDYGCRSNLFRWVEYKCNAMRYDYKNGVFLMFGCDTENAIIPPLTEDPLSKLNVRQSEDTLIYLGSMKEWCSDPIYFLPYSVLIIDGKEIKGDLVIPEGVDSIAENAFSKCTSLTSVTLPQTLVYIGENAFANCTKIRSVTCFSPYPPEAYDNTFANYNGYLYMPCDFFDEYDMHVSWGSFKHVECSSADLTDVDGLQINPDYNHAEFAWPITPDAEVYSLQITRDNELVCTLNFNEDGQLTNIDFGANSSTRSSSSHRSSNLTEGCSATPCKLSYSSLRSATSLRSSTSGYKFTVTGLQESTNYNFALDAKDQDETLLKHYEGDFKTKGDSEVGGGTTILEDNRIEKEFTIKDSVLDFRSEIGVAVYDLMGRCLFSCDGKGSFKVPYRGVYLVKIGLDCFKIVVD